jgi:hypothetical protein
MPRTGLRIVDALAPTAFACALALAAVTAAHAQTPANDAQTQTADVDPAIAQRLRGLDPDHISANDVAEVLARVPAPRIILLEGSIALVNMDPFAEFLIAMGYPADRIRNPRDGRMSGSSFTDSRQLAGMVAWYYETEGMPPILIGHSKGGALVISVLYELAGELSDPIHVWNPLTGSEESRTTIVDPATGDARPVVGVRVRYAAALATGKAAAPADRAVVAAVATSPHPRQRRRVHRLLDRVGHDRRQLWRVRPLHGHRDRGGAKRHASGCLHAYRASQRRAPRREPRHAGMDRRLRSGAGIALPTSKISIPRTSFTPPISGTASRRRGA